MRFGSESRRSTSNDAERLGGAGAGGASGYGSAAEKFLTESQRRLRNILNDSAPKPTKSNVKQPKPIIHSQPTSADYIDNDDTVTAAATAAATRSLGKMRLSDEVDVSDNLELGGTNADKKAVYFNDNIDYRSPPALANDD